MCMSMRGVRKPGTATLTTVARGLFETDKDLRDQAYRLWDCKKIRFGRIF